MDKITFFYGQRTPSMDKKTHDRHTHWDTLLWALYIARDFLYTSCIWLSHDSCLGNSDMSIYRYYPLTSDCCRDTYPDFIELYFGKYRYCDLMDQ